MDQRQDKLFGNVIKTAILWGLLQVVGGWRAFLALLGDGYDVGTWGVLALYILALLGIDFALFRLNSTNAAKGWAKYWTVCAAVLLLARGFHGTDVLEATAEIFLILLTPYYTIYPLWDCLFNSTGYIAFILILCAAQLVYLLYLARRAKK